MLNPLGFFVWQTAAWLAAWRWLALPFSIDISVSASRADAAHDYGDSVLRFPVERAAFRIGPRPHGGAEIIALQIRV